MNKFKVGDKVRTINHIFYNYEGVIKSCPKIGVNFYEVIDNDNVRHYEYEESLFLLERVECEVECKKTIKERIFGKTMNEEKELKKDVEILLNIYINNRKMNRKEIKRFSDRHFDIIEKQNAKRTLQRAGKDD